MPSARFLLAGWDCGLGNFLKRKYLPGSMYCRVDRKMKGQTEAIKLVDLTSAFFLLGIGLSLSCTIFILELLIGNPGLTLIRRSKPKRIHHHH